jgi:hypothetical protein
LFDVVVGGRMESNIFLSYSSFFVTKKKVKHPLIYQNKIRYTKFRL